MGGEAMGMIMMIMGTWVTRGDAYEGAGGDTLLSRERSTYVGACGYIHTWAHG